MTNQGEWADVCFMQAALPRGYPLSRPLSAHSAYDFILDTGARLLRVQVKSTSHPHGGVFHINASRGFRRKRAYRRHEIDFLAAYLIPLDLWYIIPVAALGSVKTINLFPQRRAGRLEKFRNRWDLLDSSHSCGTAALGCAPCGAARPARA